MWQSIELKVRFTLFSLLDIRVSTIIQGMEPDSSQRWCTPVTRGGCRVVTTPELDFHWGVASPWSLDPKAISREECARSTALGFIKLMSRTPCRQGCDLARAARSVTEILDRCRETRNLGGDINIVQLGIDTVLPCLQLSEQGCVPYKVTRIFSSNVVMLKICFFVSICCV